MPIDPDVQVLLDEISNGPLADLLARYDALTPGGDPNELIPPELLGTGTPSNSNYLRGDQAWDSLEPSGFSGYDWREQYVHVDGSDSADGRSPDRPKATLEAAYGDGDNKVVASFGKHDVGDGLSCVRNKPANFEGVARPRRYETPNWGPVTYPGIAPCIYSSTGAERLVNFDLPNVSTNAQGFRFANFVFEMLPTCEKAIDALSVCHLQTNNNLFWSKNPDAIAISADHLNLGLGNDSSWFKLKDDIAAGCQYIRAIGPNVNKWDVAGPIIFGFEQVDTAIYMAGAHRCDLSKINIEGCANGVIMGETGNPSFSNEITGIGGEKVMVMVDLIRCSASLVTLQGRSAPTTAHRVIHIGPSSTQNVVILPGRKTTGGTGSPYLADQVIDENGSNTIITGLQVDH